MTGLPMSRVPCPSPFDFEEGQTQEAGCFAVQTASRALPLR